MITYILNPTTGDLDAIDLFDVDRILTASFDVLVDNNGNVLVGA